MSSPPAEQCVAAVESQGPLAKVGSSLTRLFSSDNDSSGPTQWSVITNTSARPRRSSSLPRRASSLPRTAATADDPEVTIGTTAGQAELEASGKKLKTELSQATNWQETVQRQLDQGEQEFEADKKLIERTLHETHASTERLEQHIGALNELEAVFSTKVERDLSKAQKLVGEQTAAATRLDEEYRDATKVTASARERVEASRQQRADVADAGKLAVAKADELVVQRASEQASVHEQHETWKSIGAMMADRIVALKGHQAAADRECTFHTETLRTSFGEYDAAREALTAARAAEQQAVTAEELHDDETESKLQHLEIALERAQEAAQFASKLRILESRARLTDGDSIEHKVWDETATDAEQNCNTQVSEAQGSLEKMQLECAQRLSELEVAASGASAEVAHRESFFKSAGDKLLVRQKAASEARSKHAQLVAALQAAEVAQESFLQRLQSSETLLTAAQARADEAASAASNAQLSAAEQEAPLQHAEEAETQVLWQADANETKLLRSREAAQATVAIAKADVATVQAAMGEARVKIMTLQKEAEEAKLSIKSITLDLQAANQAATEAVTQEFVPKDCPDCNGNGLVGDDVCSVCQGVGHASAKWREVTSPAAKRRRVGGKTMTGSPAEVRVKTMERALDSAASRYDMLTNEIEGVHAEPTSLAKATEPQAGSVEAALRAELEAAQTQTYASAAREQELREESKSKAACWNQKRDELKAQLHHASLEVTRLQEDMSSNQELKGRLGI